MTNTLEGGKNTVFEARGSPRKSVVCQGIIMALGLQRKQCWNAQCQGNPYQENEIAVSGKAEEIKGRVKEAVGVVTNDEKLKQKAKSTKPPAKSNRPLKK